MKKAVTVLFCLMAIIVAITAQSQKAIIKDGENKERSPYVGRWDWQDDIEGERNFRIWVGERNDSLLFCMGGIFCAGRKIHWPSCDSNNKFIASVKTNIIEGNLIKSRISESISNFYFNCERNEEYNEVSFELLNDTTMLFILNDNKGYWPDTAIMFKKENANIEFSLEEDPLLYKEKQ